MHMHVPPHDPLTWDRIIILHVKEGRPGIGADVDLREEVWTVYAMVVSRLWSCKSGMVFCCAACTGSAVLVSVSFGRPAKSSRSRGLFSTWNSDNLAIFYLHTDNLSLLTLRHSIGIPSFCFPVVSFVQFNQLIKSFPLQAIILLPHFPY